MEAEELRVRATESLARQRRFSVLFVAYVLASLALIAVWGLTGGGYFWPGWPILAGAVAGAVVGLGRSWRDRSFTDAQIRVRAAQLSGRPPAGVQR